MPQNRSRGQKLFHRIFKFIIVRLENIADVDHRDSTIDRLNLFSI